MIIIIIIINIIILIPVFLMSNGYKGFLIGTAKTQQQLRKIVKQ